MKSLRELYRPGVRYMIASAFFFSLMALFVKLAGRRLPSEEIVLARSLVTLVLSFALLRRAGISLRGRRPGLLLLRGGLGFLALLSFYYSLTHLPLAESTVIHHMSPVFTAILAALFLGERFGVRVAISAVIAMGGIALVAQPPFLFGAGSGLPLFPVAIGFCGALLSAGAYVVVRELATNEDPLVIVFYFPLVAVPASLPMVWNAVVWPTATECVLLLLVGITTQVAQVYLTRGLALEPAGRAIALSYLQIVFATFFGVAIFGELPAATVLVGAILVVVGSLLPSLGRR